MDKQNIFRSCSFHADAGDVVHVLIKDLVGVSPAIELVDEDDNTEDEYYGGEPVVHTSDVLFVDTSNPANVYLYNPTTKASTLLTIPNVTYLSADIAHTYDKLWLYSNTGAPAFTQTVKEWNITMSPFTATYNREITLSYFNAGLAVINNATLINHMYFSPVNSRIYETNITNLIAVNTLKFNAKAGGIVTGDYFLTTTNKLISIETNTAIQHIIQYNYSTGAVELDINISSVFTGTTHPYGLFEYEGDIYIAGCAGPLGSEYGVIYKIEKTAPYAMTLWDSVVYPINGASQLPEQLTVNFS